MAKKSMEERLEALAQSVELLAGMQIKTEESLQRLERTVDRLAQTVDEASGSSPAFSLVTTNASTTWNIRSNKTNTPAECQTTRRG